MVTVTKDSTREDLLVCVRHLNDQSCTTTWSPSSAALLTGEDDDA